MGFDRLRVVALLASLLPAALARAGDYDPLRVARAQYSRLDNPEAVIPSQCYTRTDGISNPCWTCHTDRHDGNDMADWELQKRYAFSVAGTTNHWQNLFVDRRAAIAALPEAAVLAYVREDNYAPLRRALAARPDYRGWRPDIDLAAGFDDEGFARDGSGWRAVRYAPFPGTFWPTNGSADDIFVRLPPMFRGDAQGRASRELYKANFALLEAAITAADGVADAALTRVIEPVDEAEAGIDLDGDGRLGIARVVRGLPAHYAGAAATAPLQRSFYPAGTEFLHSVRYLDPDRPSLIATRMKELRYSVKRTWTDVTRLARTYAGERFHKGGGALPVFRGDADRGLLNEFGWQLQAFIEDERGRLRLQTREETYFCMGCHGTIGVTLDQTFGFPRKLPGAAGWRYQDLAGIKDVPELGHSRPEILTYFERVRGGDEFRANDEILARFFPGGVLDEGQVRRAAVGGDRDIGWLLAPSRKRALQLDAAYWLLVRDQGFARGRDTLAAPPERVHQRIDNGDTGLDGHGGIYRDGRLLLEWPAR